MNLHHVLFFCFFSALCGGNSGLVEAKLTLFTGPEGGSDDVRANRSRYSIEYKGESSGRGIVSVTIRNLTQSDSGRYRCGLGGSLVPDSFWSFGVRVSDGLLDKNSGFIQTDTEGENVTHPCKDAENRDRIFFCKGECKKEEDILIETDKNRAQSGRYSIKYEKGSPFGLYVTITQVVKSDSGQYMCGYGRALSPDSSRTFSVIVVDASIPAGSTSRTTQPPPSASPENTKTSTGLVSAPCRGYFFPLVVCLPLVFVLWGVSLLVLYQCKTRRNFGPNAEGNTDNVNMEVPITCKNWGPASKCEDSVYQNFNPASRGQDQI
ncbi:polymeric immunoglobulin receptor-like isoform X1 [Lates japonicus]|nr:polymeric immunoglobulin receptor-like isoform X1 [Lates japonicus]